MTDQLAKKLTLHEAVEAYERARAMITQAFRDVCAAEELLRETFANGTGRDYYLEVRGRNNQIKFAKPEEALQNLNSQVWGVLIDRTEVRRFMSAKACREIDKALDSNEMPPVSVKAIQDFLTSYTAKQDDLLQEAVQEVFERLRPRSNRYRSNSQFEVPEKVVVPCMVEANYGGRLSIRYTASNELRALENVFSALDGKGSVSKEYFGVFYGALTEAGKQGEHVASSEYFEGKMYKNGNLHLRFLRLDLLAKFNALAGGNRLHA